MFNINDDAVRIFVVPLLEILADREYQERVWLSDVESYSFSEFIDDFFTDCRPIIDLGEEVYKLEENRAPFEALYKMVDEFICSSPGDDLRSLLNHPKWMEIQQKAGELLKALQPTVEARRRDIIEVHLIPSIEELANKRISEYNDWFTNFSALCDFLIHRDDLDQENTEYLRDLYEKVDDFDCSYGEADMSTPEWADIQSSAAVFLDRLKKQKLTQ